LEWLRRIRDLYRLNDRRLAAETDSVKSREADDSLRQAVAGMKALMETELARPALATPCRKALAYGTAQTQLAVGRDLRGRAQV
jgi:hypothetical protein